MPERLRLEAHLGSGGFGDVYRAHDLLRDERVAVKVLRRASPRHLRMLKREFRSLAGVSHPNLVTLHELISDGDHWCITMEFIEGTDLFSYLRGVAGEVEASGWTTPDAAGAGSDVRRRALKRMAPIDEERLRATLLQVAEGVGVIHAAGRLHRDIKPKNILVTPQGRAVVLDFGLVMELGPEAAHGDSVGFGSVGYMSPEQALGLPLDAPSDWYSFGVTLFELLTGALPFEGAALQVAFQKNFADPPDPRDHCPDAPPDLAALCVRLLARQPSARPTAPEVLGALGRTPGRRTSDFPRAAAPPFVAREAEVARLGETFERAASGTGVLVTLSGPSGIGKTALLQAHVGAVARRGAALTLQGRCFERESVPYKALDGVVDSLVQRLRDLDDATLLAHLEAHGVALARLFPAFRALGPLARLDAPGARAVVDPWEQRRAAAAGLRAAIALAAGDLPVLIAIDDLHWADADSAELMRELFRADRPAALQLVVSFRPEGRDRSTALRALLDADLGLERHAVEVGPLPLDASSQLAAHALPGADADAARHVARESQGNPFFVQELSRHVLDAGTLGGAARLDDLVRARAERLPDAARRLVEVVALSRGAVPATVAFRAVGVEHAFAALSALRGGNLVRSVGDDGSLLIAYHDRVREAIEAGVAPDRARALHRALAAAWESRGDAEPEVLLTHHRAAGDLPRAAHHARLAAERAADALAFDHAAGLYRLALSLGAPEGDARRSLHLGLAAALANAGRGREAAADFLASAEGAADGERLERHRRAAEQYLRAGYIDEGLEVAGRVLAAAGVSLPETPVAGLIALALHRGRLRLRGLDYAERNESACDPFALARFDACWSVATGISVIDVVRASGLQSLGLLLALDLGEPSRVSRALAMEGAFRATAGTRGRARAAELLGRARAIAERIDRPDALALAEVMSGVACWCDGRWAEANRAYARATAVLDARCSGVAWERSTAAIFRLDALYYRGEWATLLDEVPRMREGAQERGDRYTETLAKVRFECVAGFAGDDPARVEQGLAQARAWSTSAFHTIHLTELHETAELALYRGDPEAALRTLDRSWGALRRSLLLKIQAFTVQMLYLRGRAAVGSAASTTGARRAERAERALADAAAVEAEGTAWGAGFASLVRAGVAAVRGDRAAARRLFARAAVEFDGAEMGVHAAVARRRAAELDGDAAALGACDLALGAQRVRNPARLTRMLAPADEGGGGMT